MSGPMFPVYDQESCPPESRDTLAAVRADFGMIPNLEGVMAQNPQLLEAYASTWSLFEQTSLSPAERQIVYMTANFENGCDYCIAWHTMLAKRAGLSDEAVQDLRNGFVLSEPRLAALQLFTRTMIHRNGNPLPAEFDAFIAAGFEPRHALDVVLGIAVKTMSNYTNGMSGPPLDSAVSKHEWNRPSLRTRREENHGSRT